MEIGKATSVYQTQEVKGTKETYYKEAQKVDYSKYSADDLMQIPFEEAKVNQESIDKRYQELADDGNVNAKQASKLLRIEEMKDELKKIFKKNIDFVPDKNKKILQGIIYV